MTEAGQDDKIRKMNSGGWYWVSKAVIQEYAARVGLLPIGIYHFLASMVNGNQSCFPSQKYIAERLGCSRSSVCRAMRILETHGLIKVDKRSRYHCVYRLLSLRLSAGETQVSHRRNSDVRGEDTNNTKRTILNNDNVTKVSSAANSDPLMNNEAKTREELLASDLAETLKDPGGLNAYLFYAYRYPEPFLREILSQVRQTPDQKIRRSRGALFTYLLHHHAKRTA
jgi:DNA-binding transcriptional MocR family regulator